MKTPVQEDLKQENMNKTNRDRQEELFASSHVQLPGKRLEEVGVSVQRTPVRKEDWDPKNLVDMIALAPEKTNSPGTVSQERLQPIPDGKRHFIAESLLCNGPYCSLIYERLLTGQI